MSFRDDRSWFNRTMDAAAKRRGVDLVQGPPPDSLGPWQRLEAHHHRPLEAAEAPLEDRSGGRSLSASAASSGNGEPPEPPLSPRPELTAGANPPLLLGEGSSTSPLERFALERLAFIADSLGRAAAELDTKESRKVFGGAGRSLAEYLRTLQAYAGSTTRVLEADPDVTFEVKITNATVPVEVVTPQSLRAVGPPNLRVVS